MIDADALDWERIEHEHGARHEAVVDCEQMVEKAPTIDAVPATIEGTLGYLHKVGWMQEHDRIMTEDVAPVRHGRWKHERLPSTSGGSYAVVRCSVCEYQYPMTETNYCPNCGAHMMDEEENDGN